MEGRLCLQLGVSLGATVDIYLHCIPVTFPTNELDFTIADLYYLTTWSSAMIINMFFRAVFLVYSYHPICS